MTRRGFFALIAAACVPCQSDVVAHAPQTGIVVLVDTVRYRFATPPPFAVTAGVR